MECFTWLNVNNEWDGASDTRRQNTLAKLKIMGSFWMELVQILGHHIKDLSQSPPSPPFSMLKYAIQPRYRVWEICHSTLKLGGEGVISASHHDFEGKDRCFANHFVVGCLRRHPIDFWHSVMWSAPFYQWCKLWARKRFHKNFKKFLCSDVILWRHQIFCDVTKNSNKGPIWPSWHIGYPLMRYCEG